MTEKLTREGTRCPDCGTARYLYLDKDNDRTRLDCPAGHEFPTAEPLTEAGRSADAELRERAARGATYPHGEPSTVRRAADEPLRAEGEALLARIWAFGQRRGEVALLAALRVLLAVADGLDEGQALALMARIRDGEHAAVLDEVEAL